tara:strand:+ start:1749 stop:2039 length:291 start_codon:yes stop_codon:yes gene_type:complete
MAYGLYNLTASATLIPKLADRGVINSISICNASASNTATIGLYLDDDTTSTYFVKNLVMPVGTTLILTEGLSFNNRSLALKILIAGTSPDIQVIIK